MDNANSYEKYSLKKFSANIFRVNKIDFILEKRYAPLTQCLSNKIIIFIVGTGAYGVVISAKDSQAKSEEAQQVAIKKIERTFEHRFYAKRTLRELKILRLLKHENVIQFINQLFHQIVNLLTIQLPKSRKLFHDIYVVTELLDSDLKTILENDYSKLSHDHWKLFLYQLTRGVKFMHTSNILHRDLKPRNLLLNKDDCMLKICDFGLSRAIPNEENFNSKPNIMTEYVETRYYRAPELLLGLKTYNSAVDIWSLGCIFAEIVRGKTLWKGSSCKEQCFNKISIAEVQFKMILETLGTPPKNEIEEIKDQYVKQELTEICGTLPPFKKLPLEKVAKGLNKEGVDLLEKMLTIDYTKRITAEEILNHSYFSDLHNINDEVLEF